MTGKRMVSIDGYGVHLPIYRIERSELATQFGDAGRSGDVSVPAHDEDVLTMAVSAGDMAMDHASFSGRDLDAVYVATTSDPFAERGLSPHVGAALGVDPQTTVGDFSGSARATTNALFAARDAIASQRVRNAVVIGTDIPAAAPGSTAEREVGAGAAALALSPSGNVAAFSDFSVNTTGFIGRFSRSGASPVEGNRRFNREAGYLEAVVGAVEDLDFEQPDHVAFPSYSDWGERAVRELDLSCEYHETGSDVGYIPTVSLVLDTILAFENAGQDESILTASYGAGGSDAMVLETGTGIDRSPTRSCQEYIEDKKYIPYGKYRAFRKQARGGTTHA